MANKNKKKHLKRTINAIQRSETVWRNKTKDKFQGHSLGPVILDEIQDFVETTDVITLEKPPEGSDEGPTVVCTCGWTFGPSLNLLTLGRTAKGHTEEFPGHVLRQHA